MRMRWILLALLLGVVVGGFVLLRPQRPLWIQPIPTCHELLQYSEDGKSLIVAEGMEENRALMPNASLVYYDLASGRETKRASLPFPEKTFINKVWLSSDAASIYAITSTAVTSQETGLTEELSSRTYGGPGLPVSYDIATGRRLNGPLEYEDGRSEPHFSPHQKWFCYTKPIGERSAFSMDYKNLKDTINVVSTEDFRVKHSIPYDPTTRTFHEFCFFEDETRLAILYTKWPGKPLLELMNESPEKLTTMQQVLEVFDLKTGKVIHTFNMPTTQRWNKVVKALKDQVYVEGADGILVVSFADEKNAVAAIDPILSSYNRIEAAPPALSQRNMEHGEFKMFGDSWVAHLISRDSWMPGSWEKAVRWLDSQCGTTFSNWFKANYRIAITDRHTGLIRAEVPGNIVSQLLVSNDGHYLALATYEKPGLELWDANPGSRWPYAIAAGVAPLLLVFVLVKSIKRFRNKAMKAG